MPPSNTTPRLLFLALLFSSASAAVAADPGRAHGAAASALPTASARDGLAHLHEAGNPSAALLAAERRLGDSPHDDDAFRLRALSLAELGASVLAADAVAERPALFADHERERIEGDAIARRIGWGQALATTPERRLDETRDALQRLRALQSGTPRRTRWEATRLRVDALDALNHLQRHEEVVAGYQALRAEGIDVPAYILPTVGDSFLALRRPREAIAVLQEALAHQPGHVDARVLLGYAWLERERFDLGLAEFEAVAAGQPAWPRRDGALEPYENWDRFQADLALAMAHSQANDNVRAEALLSDLVAMGPANAPLQAALGTVHARRGQPAAALQRHDMALALAPDDRDALAGRTDALLALDRVDGARDAAAALQRAWPDDPRQQRLVERLERHRGPQAVVAHAWARSTPRDAASPAPMGSRDAVTTVELRSPLLADRLRLGVVGRDSRVDFDPERTRLRSAGIGAWYRHDRLALAATASRQRDDDGREGTAWTIEAGWRANDAWRFDARLAADDPEASMQARRHGIGADSLAVSARWTPHELTSLQAGLARYRYDDGNRRDQASLDLRQRLMSRPHLLVDALAGAAAGRASLGERAAYFNPSRDASMRVGVGVDHIAWRRYEASFRQRLEVTAGPYRQRGYGTHWTPAVSYRHVWDSGRGPSLEYGVAWSRPVYDGAREQRIAFDAVLSWGAAP
ncbi:tetratricopeptide repeat protein [Luteimonas padinae]|uniref:Tetratricopeptide repeat protein n=1 Tax=Luteimonas padinae TaxID=1714359 RepID=A0ABV6SW10_9GAMM|nr:tetratricopeptide repeat protein [Luteimonas padinae]